MRTVINKTDEVGTENEYRTFSYELLAGEDDMNVEVNEENCIFQFDYAKVYWNSRLNTEHRRLVSMFKPGEAICDVMAGVGPFSIPAGKKRCFVWANDLNPASFKSLETAVTRNKVTCCPATSRNQPTDDQATDGRTKRSNTSSAPSTSTAAPSSAPQPTAS